MFGVAKAEGQCDLVILGVANRSYENYVWSLYGKIGRSCPRKRFQLDSG